MLLKKDKCSLFPLPTLTPNKRAAELQTTTETSWWLWWSMKTTFLRIMQDSWYYNPKMFIRVSQICCIEGKEIQCWWVFHHTILKGEKSFLISVNKVFLACIKHQHQIFTAVIPAQCPISSNVFDKKNILMWLYLICWFQKFKPHKNFRAQTLKYTG